MRSIASYRYANLGWNPLRPAVMGYQALLSNAFYNYPGNVYQLASIPGPGSSKYFIITQQVRVPLLQVLLQVIC